MTIGSITIDIQAIIDFFTTQSTPEVVLGVLALGGWLVLFYLLLYADLLLFVEHKQRHFTHNWKWVLLAVDVPLLNVQTPKAVEQMFAHLTGAHAHTNIAEKYGEGLKQRWFSLEVISIEGYIQFLIRTEEKFRDLVEAAFYAQYPDAEVTEVEDYVDSVPSTYPNETHDIWAADFGLSENDAYPIRIYRDFEHNISKDTVLKDPMGAFLESFSRIGPGEQIWFQIIIEPAGHHWKEHAIEKINKIIGAEEKHSKPGLFSIAFDGLFKLLGSFFDHVLGNESEEGGGHKDEKSGPPNKVQYLTPGQKKIVEDMETKISKVGFKTKIRAVYIARKEVFRPERAVNAIIGSMQQYNVPTANMIEPKLRVTAFYLFAKQRTAYRKNLLIRAYKKRKIKAGVTPFILNIEELATIWHFPMSHVKTPLVQKTSGKQAEPPSGLPVERMGGAALSYGIPIEEIAPEVPKPLGLAKRDPNKYLTDSGDIAFAEDQKFG
ncbi:MAG: hypothetical protein HY984_01060 [Candidatus Magasanikbacteria bacterium]|nr:hypothetical protein [Candidatus Magasanikbacteria bacterium]